MCASILIEERVEIPEGINSLAEFRCWSRSGNFPTVGRIDYLDGRIEVDMAPDDLFAHCTPRKKLAERISARVDELDLGKLFAASARMSNCVAALSAQPDIVLVSRESLCSGRVRLIPPLPGADEGAVEIEGSPDLVVEVVSDRSAAKDRERLPEFYAAAGVREYWVVDPREDLLQFEIRSPLRYGLEPVDVDADGFQESAVLGRGFRVDRQRDEDGIWRYELVCS